MGQFPGVRVAGVEALELESVRELVAYVLAGGGLFVHGGDGQLLDALNLARLPGLRYPDGCRG